VLGVLRGFGFSVLPFEAGLVDKAACKFGSKPCSKSSSSSNSPGLARNIALRSAAFKPALAVTSKFLENAGSVPQLAERHTKRFFF
jgi:hypothetical protein